MVKPSPPGPVPVDPEQWSERSKRSVSYDFAHTVRRVYTDIQYSCWRCQAGATYTAEDQREAFELRKAYIHQQRILCGDCWRQRRKIERAIGECRAAWKAGRHQLVRDLEFLNKWLQLLDGAAGYALRRDTAAISMLRRLLGTAGGPTTR